MSENKLKYLEKYTAPFKSKSHKSNKNKNSKIVIVDQELNQYSNHTEETDHNNDNNIISHDKEIWKEISEEENEDELKALEYAKKELRHDRHDTDSEKEEKVVGNKRRRHDSESENEIESERELDELIKDEDGDLLLNDDSEKKAGLVLEFKTKRIDKKLKDENLLQKEREKLKQETVYRDELGRKVDKSETKEAKRKELEKINYNNMQKWAKGIIQKEEELLKREEMRKVKNEPFARHDIDRDTEQELKNKTRFGDPMKELMSIHKFDKGINTTDKGNRNISRGFYLPRCKFTGTPNRFGIEPGYRWDGVDRGTGFEMKYLQSLNSRRARDEEYHKIRTEDM